jgi:hypothetical protein
MLLAVVFGFCTQLALAKPGDEPSPASLPAEPAKQPTSRELPWTKKPKTSALPVLRPPANVREIMEKYDIGESQLAGFFDNQPLSPSEEDVLARLLFRLPRIGLENLERWRKPEIQLEQLLVNSTSHRLEVIPLEGRLTGVAKMEVPPELAIRLEFKHYYLARVSLRENSYEGLIALRRVPEYWLTAAELDEPVTLDGIYIKVLDATAEPPQLLFITRRIRWMPDKPVPELHIGEDQLRLARLGFDLSLLEDLRSSNKQPIGDLDREPQYQLLDLVGRVPVSALASNPRKEIDIVALLKEPEKHQGELLAVQGYARRIIKIVVDDPDIRARFGIDHYYEIDVFVDLKKTTIHFVDEKKPTPPKTTGRDEADAQSGEQLQDGAKPTEGTTERHQKPAEPKGPIFNNDYPVTIVVRELPPDLKPIDDTRQLIHVDAIFMKTWAYRNNYMAQFDNRMQVAPLLVGKIAYRVVPPRVYNWISDVLVGSAMALAGLIIVAVLWWFRSADRTIRETLDGLAERAPQPNFAGLENVPTKPDFSGLETAAPNSPPEESQN